MSLILSVRASAYSEHKNKIIYLVHFIRYLSIFICFVENILVAIVVD